LKDWSAATSTCTQKSSSLELRNQVIYAGEIVAKCMMEIIHAQGAYE
jgi:hypothetical protein